MTKLSNGVLLCMLTGWQVTTFAIDQEPHMLYTVLPGKYTLIGKEPDGGATYAGTAKITLKDGVLELTKKIGAKTIIAEGIVLRASPGEADVIRFRWQGQTSTCLNQLDLDNYSRLTCYWTLDGATHKEPGLEAFFSTETWP